VSAAAHIPRVSENDGHLYLGDRVAWDGRRLVVTDPDLLRRIDKPYLSASTAKALHSCPAQYVASRALPRVEDIFGAAEKGTAAHLVLERLYGLEPGRRDPQHAAKILTDLVLQDPEPDQVDYGRAIGTDPVRYTQWIAAVSAAYSGIFTITDPREAVVYARELRLDGCEVGGVPFKGFVDLIEGTLEDGLKIRDFKTGKDKSRPNPRFDDDHGDQIRLYHLALRHKLGVDSVEGALFYIEHGTKRVVDLSPKALDRTRKGFEKSWDELHGCVQSAAFEAKPSGLCGWCPLVNACPVAREARNPSDPRATKPSEVDLGIPTLRPVGSQAVAAHMQTEAPHGVQEREDETMTARTRGAREEAKPWEPTVNGELNLASYAAVATIGLAGLSAELLAERRQDLAAIGQKVGPAQLRALTGVLSRVVLSVQGEIAGGSNDWSEGVNTRVRGALRSVIVAMPLPIGSDADAWAQWERRAATFAKAIVLTGMALFDGDLDADTRALLPVEVAEKADPKAA